MGGSLAQQLAQPWSSVALKASWPWPFSLQMLLTFDDQFLLTAAEDGCLFTWKVFDKDGRGIKREREVGFAEEVLVTKTDMEEKVRTGSNEEGHGIPYQTAFKCGSSTRALYSLATTCVQCRPPRLPAHAPSTQPSSPPHCHCPPYSACLSAMWSSWLTLCFAFILWSDFPLPTLWNQEQWNIQFSYDQQFLAHAGHMEDNQ